MINNSKLPFMPQPEKTKRQLRASIDFPTTNPEPDFRFSGLSKREYFAGKIFASIAGLTNDPLYIEALETVDGNTAKALAKTAASYADALLFELDK